MEKTLESSQNGDKIGAVERMLNRLEVDTDYTDRTVGSVRQRVSRAGRRLS